MNRRGFLKSVAAAAGLAAVPVPEVVADPVAAATVVFKAGQQPEVTYWSEWIDMRNYRGMSVGTVEFTPRRIVKHLNLSGGPQEALDSGCEL